MAGLVVALDRPRMGVVDCRGDAIEIAIEQIDMDTLHHEPAAAIDPRPPAADRGHGRGGATIIQGDDDPAQRRDIDRLVTTVVQAQVIVGGRRRRAAGARPAQRDRGDATYRRESCDQSP